MGSPNGGVGRVREFLQDEKFEEICRKILEKRPDLFGLLSTRHELQSAFRFAHATVLMDLRPSAGVELGLQATEGISIDFYKFASGEWNEQRIQVLADKLVLHCHRNRIALRVGEVLDKDKEE